MKPSENEKRARPERITGIAHLFAAFRYSVAGVRRLWCEVAFRHIVLAFGVLCILFVVIGAGFADYCILLILFFSLVAVEALNTAIECVVDHLTTDWAEFARDAKDLGSLATMCLLCANAVFILSVVIRSLELL